MFLVLLEAALELLVVKKQHPKAINGVFVMLLIVYIVCTLQRMEICT